MNKHIVVGNMVADAEEFGNPVAGARFRIATNDYDPGKKARITTYHDCKIFGKRTEVVTKYGGKGVLVGVSGTPRDETYTPSKGPNAGREVTKRILIVDDFKLMGSGKPAHEEEDDDSNSW